MVTNKPVLQRAQVTQTHLIAFQRVPEDLAHAGRVGTERRHNAFRQLLCEKVQAFQHARPSPVKIDVVFEDHIDHREAKRRTRAHHAHTGQALQIRDQRIRDLIFDFLRRPPGPIREHDHLVLREVRNRVDGRAQQGPVPPGREPKIDRDHQATMAQTEFD